jgi:hypothetical protein
MATPQLDIGSYSSLPRSDFGCFCSRTMHHSRSRGGSFNQHSPCLSTSTMTPPRGPHTGSRTRMVLREAEKPQTTTHMAQVACDMCHIACNMSGALERPFGSRTVRTNLGKVQYHEIQSVDIGVEPFYCTWNEVGAGGCGRRVLDMPRSLTVTYLRYYTSMHVSEKGRATILHSGSLLQQYNCNSVIPEPLDRVRVRASALS